MGDLELNPRERAREFRSYPRELCDEVVVRYLFDGLSTRKLDDMVLSKDPVYSHGYQSHSILHYIGLEVEAKGCFKGMDWRDVLERIGDTQPIIANMIECYFEGRAEDDVPSQSDVVSEELGLDTMTVRKVRVNQDRFRRKVLDAYGGRCCITGISELGILRASHIKPWSMSGGGERMDVRNGICLNTLHDSAFDIGLMTVDPGSLEVIYSDGLQEAVGDEPFSRHFAKYEGMQIDLPVDGAEPGEDYLRYHRDFIFGRKTNRVRLILELDESVRWGPIGLDMDSWEIHIIRYVRDYHYLAIFL